MTSRQRAQYLRRATRRCPGCRTYNNRAACRRCGYEPFPARTNWTVFPRTDS